MAASEVASFKMNFFRIVGTFRGLNFGQWKSSMFTCYRRRQKSKLLHVVAFSFKVHMKQNQFFNSLKVQHFKDTIPKFEPCLKIIGDFITPENCTILLSKMVFELHGQNVLMT